MAEAKKRFKLDRRLLIWVLPAVLVPTVVFLLITKGSDLGQAELDAEAAKKAKEEQAQRMSARVDNPEAAAMEEAKRALEAAKREEATKLRENALPPPPSAADLEAKSRGARKNELLDSRVVIGSALNDAERQSTGLAGGGPAAAEKKNSFVVYTSPAKENMLTNTVAAVTPDIKLDKPAEPVKPHLSANNDKVKPETVNAAKRVDGLYWIAPGTIIRAVLLNAVNTQVPGQVTARTTEPIYDSRYGRYMVIPPGSTLIGQYDSEMANGQSRVMMAFTSLVTPSGGVVDLSGTRGSDALGRLGVAGEMHTHFWRRMGTALLFALMSVGMDQLNDGTTTMTAPGSTTTTTNTSKGAEIMAEAAKQDPYLKPIAPYVTIEEGQQISVVTMASIEVPPVANKR